MRLRVTEVEAHDIFGSVRVAVGVNAEGERWRFGGDWRPMRDVAAALEAGEEPEVEVEAWQLLGRAQ